MALRSSFNILQKYGHGGNQGETIKQHVDKMFVILPFEKEFT